MIVRGGPCDGMGGGVCDGGCEGGDSLGAMLNPQNAQNVEPGLFSWPQLAH